jgi:hypothetical protein
MRTAPALFALALGLAGCLENDEEITVRPDGSVSVEIAAKGKMKDLSDGYPVPLDGPWSPQTDATREWLRLVGPDTGSAPVRANAEALGGRSALLPADQDVELRVRAEFASVRDLPRFFAPASEAFRSAYLERASELRVEKKGARTVYTFERTYRGRAFERFDTESRMKKVVPKKLFAKLEKDEPLGDGEREQVAAAAVDAMRGVSVDTAGEALGSIYVQGDASLPIADAAKILDAVRGEIERVVTRERIDRILAGAFPVAGQAKSEDSEREIASLERDVREALRSSFERAIAVAGVAGPARNALRGELEWLFTAHDHTGDLGDDSFQVVVHLPGTIVGGNADEAGGGTATWKFDGEGLRDRDRVLRAVSVVE